MIISCAKCSKKFEINSDLIPESGRLLECSSCSHQWFFKKKNDVTEKTITNKADQINDFKKSVSEDTKKKTRNIQKIKKIDKKEINTNLSESKTYLPTLNKSTEDKNISFLNTIFLFMISFAAFIVLIDTFKTPISIIYPGLELILYNLYETFKDIILFSKDLI
jgi:predicted Zn finger-like uncharacterized protein